MSKEFRARPTPPAPTHPIASKAFFAADKKIINIRRLFCGRQSLCMRESSRLKPGADESRRTAKWRLWQSKPDTSTRRGSSLPRLLEEAMRSLRHFVPTRPRLVPLRRAGEPPRLRLGIVQERQQDVTAACRDRRGLMQQRAGKHHSGPRTGLVAMGIIFGKEDMPARVFRIQIHRQRELPKAHVRR